MAISDSLQKAQKKYIEKNKDKINERAKAYSFNKYHNNEDYKQKKKEQALKRYYEKKGAFLCDMAEAKEI